MDRVARAGAATKQSSGRTKVLIEHSAQADYCTRVSTSCYISRMVKVRGSSVWLRGLVLGLMVASTPACFGHATPSSAASLSQANSTKVELYFGRRSAGRLITDPELQDFIVKSVRPRLPGGYTIMQGTGFWTSPSGEQVDEETTILMVAFPRETPASLVDQSVDPIRTDYCARFAQQSVLRLDTLVDISVSPKP
ncbi:MAG: hypothetical protein JWN04_4658 [Myxococcaceae bacterium]|nr:hypothetical protein [Myxococcaceae bacterium]